MSEDDAQDLIPNDQPDEQDAQLEATPDETDATQDDGDSVEEEADEGLTPAQIRGIVEAVLMTSDTPVTPGKLQALIKGVNGRDLRQAVDGLNETYQQGEHAMFITEVAGGFQIVTRRQFGPWVRKFHDRSQVRLSQAALETLAIIAFKQPVTRVEVDSVRGVDSGGVLRTLMELNMIRIVGRSEGVGRPMLFGTTRDFMTHFGLRSLADLPKPKELEELLAEGERKAHAGAANGAADAGPPDDGLPAVGEPVLEAPDQAPDQSYDEADDDMDAEATDVDETPDEDDLTENN